MARKRKKLGEILVDQNAISESSLPEALDYAQKHGKRIGEALVELELCDTDQIAQALAEQFGFEYVDLGQTKIEPETLALIPSQLISSNLVLPLEQLDETRLRVIVTDPLDLETMDLLRFRLSREIIPVLADIKHVKDYIERFVDQSGDELSKTMASIDQEAPEEEIAKPLGSALAAQEDDAPIVKLLNKIIIEAVHSRASDIHIEPMADRVRVRYRIDGVCLVRDDIPISLRNAVSARLKIMSGLDIAEKRLPQDGRIKMQIGSGPIDFRVSCCPAYHGESIVLRILRPESAKIGLMGLGFGEEDFAIFQSIIKRPNGIFLVTGPTGSGKTTTLYSALQDLNRPDKKIITAEDPVEYNFAGMNQCQVREEIGLSFSKILRAMLRQAPNIILVGEIRDKEVGEVAIQAALTGHLVFSTLHTNDAPSAITRLIDMGIKPFLVASSIQAVMAQRLVRILCDECRVVDANPDKRVLSLLGFSAQELEGKSTYIGAGCKRCSDTGYRGRRGIFEIMKMDGKLRELAFNRAPSNQMRAAAKAAGMKTLLMDGKNKILAGVTTAEELLRITQAEGILEND